MIEILNIFYKKHIVRRMPIKRHAAFHSLHRFEINAEAHRHKNSKKAGTIIGPTTTAAPGHYAQLAHAKYMNT
jgi:hypothetical protein